MNFSLNSQVCCLFHLKHTMCLQWLLLKIDKFYILRHGRKKYVHNLRRFLFIFSLTFYTLLQITHMNKSEH